MYVLNEIIRRTGCHSNILEYYRKFYLQFPDFEIVNELVHNLNWTHIRRILSATSPEARIWYLTNASKNMWIVSTFLQPNICHLKKCYVRKLNARRNFSLNTMKTSDIFGGQKINIFIF